MPTHAADKTPGTAFADDAQLDPMLSPRQTVIEAGLSLPTIQRMQAQNKFPPFVRLSPGRSGLPLSAVRAWREALPTAKDEPSVFKPPVQTKGAR